MLSQMLPRITKSAILPVIALWVMKCAELLAREYGWMPRNLGWGYLVDVTVPVVATFLLILPRGTPKTGQ